MENIPLQQELRPAFPPIPNVFGAKDYQVFSDTLVKIDQILSHTYLEKRCIETAFHRENEQDTLSSKLTLRQKTAKYRKLRYALRCNIARALLGESFRAFSIRLADSQLLQWFVGIGDFEKRKAVSKSALERYEKLFDTQKIDEQIKAWLASLSSSSEKFQTIGLNQSLSFEDIWVDSTCVKGNIHFPTDWVLLKDAARSLLKAIGTIRNLGLKHRMIASEILMRRMNKLSIEMTHVRRQTKGKKKRKAILRKMKNLSHCISKHAERYKTILLEGWTETSWSEAQMQRVIERIDNILKQLPLAIEQAHERIIGERQMRSRDKILSLYEPDMHVILRGKAGYEVEFGQGLQLCEQKDGLIIHWKLDREYPTPDSKSLQGSIREIEKCYGKINAVSADRGYHSKNNEIFLRERHIFSALCPRSPHQLHARLQEPLFIKLQTRRAQTESRISIFKNNFLGRPLRSKGFIHREQRVTWCVLTHNLWVVARKALADERLLLQNAA